MRQMRGITKRVTPLRAATVAIVLGAASFAFTAGSDATTATTATTAPTSTLRVAVPQSAQPLDPATLQSNISIALAQNIFDGLTDVNPTTGAAIPAIASHWTVSPDGKTYTFYLRPGVKFSNGDPVTAEDFVYSWNRVLSPKTASPDLFFLSGIKGANAVSAGKAKTASGITALNATTLRVVLTAPAGYFLALVSRWPFWVLDPQVVNKYGASWDTPPHIVGTGAYELTNTVGDTEYDFTANPNYFGGKPKIPSVKVNVVANPTVLVARYQAGEFDAVFGLDAAALRQAKNDSTLKQQLHVKQQLGAEWLGMNDTIKPFDNADVRQAFSYAIDRKGLISVALDGLGHPTGTFLPPGIPGAIANTPAASAYGAYNPAKAQKLLADAGYPGGQGFPSQTIYTNNVSTNQTVAQYVQAELSQNLHVKVSIKTMTPNAYQALLNNLKTVPALYNAGFSFDYPDAQEMLQYFGTSGPNGFANYAHYDNPSFDALVNKAIATTSPSQRAKLYNRAERLFMSKEPVVPLYNQDVAWLEKPYVHGVGQSAQYIKKWNLGSLVGVKG